MLKSAKNHLPYFSEKNIEVRIRSQNKQKHLIEKEIFTWQTT